ncbi:MAG: hypothetical protein U9R79_18480 [Armatimonadota bacterium]|nr:hypothetical protein [Armatimonadota bacterium]
MSCEGRQCRPRPWLRAAAAVVLAGLCALAWADDDVRRPRAAVYDFTDSGDWPGRLVGRRAADAVHAELAEAAPWELVDRGLVLRLCESEGLQPPFGVGYLQMLGERSRSPLAVTGLVRTCTVNERRGVAQVTVLAELIETIGGSSLASVRGVASARRKPGEVAAIGQVVDRALGEAAGDIVRSLTRFDPTQAPVVTVLPDGRVVIDGPEEPALRPGDVLLLYRGENGSAVGAVRVESVSLTVVHARPLTGYEPQAGDRGVLVAR